MRINLLFLKIIDKSLNTTSKSLDYVNLFVQPNFENFCNQQFCYVVAVVFIDITLKRLLECETKYRFT